MPRSPRCSKGGADLLDGRVVLDGEQLTHTHTRTLTRTHSVSHTQKHTLTGSPAGWAGCARWTAA
jgi:hypothetical protein